MHLQDVQIQCHLLWDTCGCEFFFTILHFPFKYCTINNKNLIKPNLSTQKQNCPFIFLKYWWQIAQLAKQSSPSQKWSCTVMCHGWLQHSFLPHTLYLCWAMLQQVASKVLKKLKIVHIADMQSVLLLICVKGEEIVHGALVQVIASAKTLVQRLLKTCYISMPWYSLIMYKENQIYCCKSGQVHNNCNSRILHEFWISLQACHNIYLLYIRRIKFIWCKSS